jgi:hypothetical protein
MTLWNLQVWNGKKWETKAFSVNSEEVKNIAAELNEYGVRAIVVGDGYMPKPKRTLDDDTVREMLKRNG